LTGRNHIFSHLVATWSDTGADANEDIRGVAIKRRIHALNHLSRNSSYCSAPSCVTYADHVPLWVKE
jgi:hypothetical protein